MDEPVIDTGLRGEASRADRGLSRVDEQPLGGIEERRVGGDLLCGSRLSHLTKSFD